MYGSLLTETNLGLSSSLKSFISVKVEKMSYFSTFSLSPSPSPSSFLDPELMKLCFWSSVFVNLGTPENSDWVANKFFVPPNNGPCFDAPNKLDELDFSEFEAIISF